MTNFFSRLLIVRSAVASPAPCTKLVALEVKLEGLVRHRQSCFLLDLLGTNVITSSFSLTE